VNELACNGVPVLGGEILLFALGRWAAYLTLDDASEVSGAATIATADGSFTLTGTVRRGGAFQERGRVEVVGGADALHTELPPFFYRGISGRAVLRDILRACGERLSDASNVPELDQQLPFWTRRRGPASEALEALCEHYGCTWRVLTDGTVWLGRETWPAVDPGHDLMDADPSDDRATLAFDALPADLVPGVTFRGQRVVRVVHAVGASQTRTTVYYSPSGLDPGLGDQQELIRGTMRGVLHHTLWPATVVQQDADGSVQCVLSPELPEAQRMMPTMVGIPLRAPAPGVTMTVPSGTKCLVAFEGGDPSRPVAALWDGGTGNFTTLKLGANATKAAARTDDAILPGTLAVVFAPGSGSAALTLTYTPPGGSPQVVSGTGGTITLGGKVGPGSALVAIE